jgi:hypothetical protein
LYDLFRFAKKRLLCGVLQNNPEIPAKDWVSLIMLLINNKIIEGSFEGILLGPFDMATGR